MNRERLLLYIGHEVLLVKQDHPIRVAIDGIDAAGKTTLANELIPILSGFGREVIRASIDGFHNSKDIRYRLGEDSPDGYYLDSFNNTELIRRLLAPLGPVGNLKYRTKNFNFQANHKTCAVTKEARKDSILIFDGVFLMRKELLEYWDYRIFLDVAFEESVSRASRRDVYLFGSEENVSDRYWRKYVPGQKLYFADANPKMHADIVIDNNDPANPVVLSRKTTDGKPS